MFAALVLIVGMGAPATEGWKPLFRSGKNGNIVVVLNPGLAAQQPPKPKGGQIVILPALSLALDEKGRLRCHDNPLLGEVSDKDLKSLVASLFRDRDAAELVIVVREPDSPPFATLVVVIEKLSEAVDKKKVLTLYIQNGK